MNSSNLDRGQSREVPEDNSEAEGFQFHRDQGPQQMVVAARQVLRPGSNRKAVEIFHVQAGKQPIPPCHVEVFRFQKEEVPAAATSTRTATERF